MAHIHTREGEHDTTVSAFIVLHDRSHGSQVLLHRHKKLGLWLQFGGHVELAETPWQAIAHEITEESGYELNELKLYQPVQRLKRLTNAALHPQPVCINTHGFAGGSDHYHTDLSYAFSAAHEPHREVAEGESSEFKAFSLEEFRALPHDQIPENVREIAIFILTKIMSDWEEVDPYQYPL